MPGVRTHTHIQHSWRIFVINQISKHIHRRALFAVQASMCCCMSHIQIQANCRNAFWFICKPQSHEFLFGFWIIVIICMRISCDIAYLIWNYGRQIWEEHSFVHAPLSWRYPHLPIFHFYSTRASSPSHIHHARVSSVYNPSSRKQQHLCLHAIAIVTATNAVNAFDSIVVY